MHSALSLSIADLILQGVYNPRNPVTQDRFFQIRLGTIVVLKLMED